MGAELVEKFLKDISTETVSYDDLSAWMDAEGSKIFQSSQAEYFEKHKAEYLEDTNSYPPPVKIALAYEQIACGFDKIFEKLTQQFPSLKNDINDKYTICKKECLGEAFLPFIAARAMITGLMVKTNEPNRLKNLESAIKAFEFLESASKASIESMNEFRLKIQPVISRGSSSPVLHKAKQEQEVVTIDNNSQVLDDSLVLKIKN